MRLKPLAAINAGLALLLLGLGLPPTLAAFARLPASPVLEQVARGRAIEPALLDHALSALQAARRWSDDSAIWSEIGWSHIGLARMEKGTDRAAVDLREAAINLTAALARAPGDSRDWGGLALARSAQGEGAGAAQALSMSLMTYPHRPEWTLPRCELGFLVYDHLDDFGRHLFDEQLRYAWAHDPSHLLAVAKLADFTQPKGLTLLHDALAVDSRQAAEFDSALQERR